MTIAERDSLLKPGVTCYWKTTNQQNFQKDPQEKPNKSTRPEWSLPRRPIATVAYPQPLSETQFSLGTYGQNPRDKLPYDSSGFRKWQHEMTAGTSKASDAIPGYQGHIPKQICATKAYQHGQLKQPRDTWIKQNIVENFHTRVPGYCGHRPMSCINDRGNIRPFCLSTKGEVYDWQWHWWIIQLFI